MNRQEITERLNKIFAKVFDDDDIVITDKTTADDIDDWDSLEHIRLMGAVEREFGIKFTMREMSSMKDVGEMIDIIAARG